MTNEIRAAHILVNSEIQAKDLLQKMNAGESFSELAKKYSQCPSGRRGGDLGWFGRGQMVKEFEDAAFEGQEGSTVGPIRTQFGWHLIRVLDRR